MQNAALNPSPVPEYLVACLCAAWCSTCRDYRAGFEALATRFPDTAFRWVDIEDDADWAGDFDIENLPTLLIFHHDTVVFFGPMLPQPGILERTFKALRAMTVEEAHASAARSAEHRQWQALRPLRVTLLAHPPR